MEEKKRSTRKKHEETEAELMVDSVLGEEGREGSALLNSQFSMASSGQLYHSRQNSPG